MPFEYIEDSVTSDVTFRAWGRDLEELFAAAADATTNVMVGTLDSIQSAVVKTVSLSAESLDLLLMRLLDEIIFHKDAEGLLLRVRSVHVEPVAEGHHLQAELAGETIDPSRHELIADVKAVTLYGLRVERDAAGWSGQVTLDV